MRNLKTIEKKVRAVLEKNEDARNDDMLLYLGLCNVCLKDAGAMPLAEIMTQHKYLGLPSFESVSRTRRKLFSGHPSGFTGFLNRLSHRHKIELEVVISLVHKLTTYSLKILPLYFTEM